MQFKGHHLLTFWFNKKMTHLGAHAKQRRGGYCWIDYNQVYNNKSCLGKLTWQSKSEYGHFVSGINLNSIFAPNASAILVRKDKLGVLVPFSNLAMEGCRVPTISAS